MLTFEQIKELIELVARNHLAGMELERSGFRLKIDGEQVKSSPPVAAGAAPAVPVAVAAPAPMPAVVAPAAPAAVPAPVVEEAPAEEPAKGDHVLTSPIVGTFYASPNPDAPAFVKVGDKVTKGQVVCIVEAMKLMNEIEADVDGEIVEVNGALEDNPGMVNDDPMGEAWFFKMKVEDLSPMDEMMDEAAYKDFVE